MKKCIVFLLCLIFLFGFCACNKTPLKTENLRVVAYLVPGSLESLNSLDCSHFKDLTDIIVFNCAGINASGEVVYCQNFDKIISGLKELGAGHNLRWHLNLNNICDGDPQKEMKKAFRGKVLPENIRAALEKYDFDGVFFDYEYPEKLIAKLDFSIFLKNLKKCIGNDFIIGAALSAWCARLLPGAVKALDMVELMSYDNWDENGYHSTMELAEQDVKKMLRLGYKRSQIDLGLPFYARPTTKEAYWFNYGEYWNLLDENGLVKDQNTGLTASFNTPELIYDKTNWAIENGLGGVMVWHYACDVSADNDASLFNAIVRAKTASDAKG